MKYSIGLSAEEKKAYCNRLTAELVRLRKRLGLTQEELEETSGISRVTLSQIESGRSSMSWLHFASLMQLFTQNQETKELVYACGLLDDRLLRTYQQLEPEEQPDYDQRIPELVSV